MTLSRAPVRNGARLPKGGRFLPGTSRRALCRMIKRSSPGKARDILVACCKRKEGNGIWFIARELMRPYSTIRGWLVRMMRRGLGGRFDRKSTGRKKILNPQTLKKIMEWTRRDPSRYGFGPASWRLDMVNEMIRRETGRHARPRTLRRILRRLGLSYSKPRPVPRKTAPAEEQDMFKEKDEKDDPERVRARVRGAGSRRGRRHARDIARIRVASSQEPRRGTHRVLHQGSQAVSGRLDETGST